MKNPLAIIFLAGLIISCNETDKTGGRVSQDDPSKSALQGDPQSDIQKTEEAEPTAALKDLVYNTFNVKEIKCFDSDLEVSPKPDLPIFHEYFALREVSALWINKGKQQAQNRLQLYMEEANVESSRLREFRNTRAAELALKKEQMQTARSQALERSDELDEQRQDGSLTDSDYRGLQQEELAPLFTRWAELKAEVADLEPLIEEEKALIDPQIKSLKSKESFYRALLSSVESAEKASELSRLQIDFLDFFMTYEFELGVGPDACKLSRYFMVESFPPDIDQVVRGGEELNFEFQVKYRSYSTFWENIPGSICHHLMPLPERLTSMGSRIVDTFEFDSEAQVAITEGLEAQINLISDHPDRVQDVCGADADRVLIELAPL